MYPGTAKNKEIVRTATTVLPFKQDSGNLLDSAEAISIPAVNIVETATEYLLEIAAPGMERENFNIEIEESVLSISAKSEKSSEAITISDRCEYNYDEWTRAFALPEDADVVLAHAKYNNGELIIRIPRGNTNENKVKTTVYVY